MQIFAMRPDGSKLRQVTSSSGAKSFPGFSPDGFNLAYVTGGKVYTVDITGGHEEPILPTEQQMQTIQMILGGLGAISLLVAALGITNTMIMSIYERTREIGIMKVLGCHVPNIRTMFLMEAGAIGFLGGVIGIAISYSISFLINMAAASQGKGEHAGGGLFASGSAISVIPFWLALGALAFATLVGLVSGLNPSNRAVKISALTAIKQD
jgi:ABC-type antimicrobial peptide transport system permease subunit